MTIVRLSESEMRGFEQSAEEDPAIKRLNQLTVEYAQKQGGITLEFWKLHMGRLFGLPWMMTVDECAKRLRLPISQLKSIAIESEYAIAKRWEASAEYQRSEWPERRSRDKAR